MGSDWDYINEHMGGHDEDGMPNFMNEPGFGDDNHETEITIIPDQKPILKHKNGLPVDDLDWVYTAAKNKNTLFEKLVFHTLDDVKNYAISFPETCVTKNPNGHGYIIRKVTNISHNTTKRIENIKKGKPPRSHFPWEDKEVAQLIISFNSGKQVYEIAIELERSARSILAKLNKIGLITTEEHQKMLHNPEFKPSCNKLFEVLMNNTYIAVNLLSRFYPFDEFLINRYANILNFEELSSSEYVNWSDTLIEKYTDRWNWYKLSNNKSLIWSESLISKFEKFWTWGHSSQRREPAFDGMGGHFVYTDYYFGLSNNESIPWNESIIEKYTDKWSWNTSEGRHASDQREENLNFCNNKSLPWSEALIEKFSNKWNWHYLSYSEFLPWSEELIEKFHDEWDWFSLSANESLPWSEAFIKRYEHNLKWNWISGNRSIPWSEALIEKYIDKWNWYTLSKNRSLPWSEALVEKYKDKWNWGDFAEGGLSSNEALPWSESFIIKYKNKWNWYALSGNRFLPWSEHLIELYKDKWNWGDEYEGGLSSNEALPWSKELVDKYIDKWSFGEDRQAGLSGNAALPWDEEFFKKYIDKWFFYPEEWSDKFDKHGGINENIALPLNSTFIDKYMNEFVCNYLVENKGLVWDENLLEIFISRQCFSRQKNTEVHKLIRKFNPSQVHVIFENHKNCN